MTKTELRVAALDFAVRSIGGPTDGASRVRLAEEYMDFLAKDWVYGAEVGVPTTSMVPPEGRVQQKGKK